MQQLHMIKHGLAAAHSDLCAAWNVRLLPTYR